MEQSSILRINVRGYLFKAGNYSFLERSRTSPLFAIVATEFSVVNIVYTIPKPVAFESIVVSDDEAEEGVANKNIDISASEHQGGIIIDKGPDYCEVGITGAEHTEKGTRTPISQTCKHLQYLRLSHPSRS